MSSKKVVFLDRERVLELATIKWATRPKGIDGLVGDWAARHEVDDKFPKPRNRSSIYTWLNRGAPPGTDALLGLAAMLDADPLTIFDFERNGYFDRFTQLREQIYFYVVGGGRFRSILDLMAPRQSWPNDSLAKTYFGRPWFNEHFEHRAGTELNNFADVDITFDNSNRYAPKCIHIAYRRANSRDKLWRYYGTVQKFRGKTRLFSESGAYVEETDEQENDNSLKFKTYFGATHVEFRVASLHAFACNVQFPSISNTKFLFEPDPRH
tara:strand:- start:1067 stop:1867 length:801 start_codon:yes stop_codon:yes gene_type:complete